MKIKPAKSNSNYRLINENRSFFNDFQMVCRNGASKYIGQAIALFILAQAAVMSPAPAQNAENLQDSDLRPSPALAQKSVAPPDDANADAAETPARQPAPQPTFNLNSKNLTDKAQAYKLAPDDSTWQGFLQALKSYLSDLRVLRAPASQIIAQNPALKDMQTKIIDAGGSRVFLFPGSKHSHTLVIQSGGGQPTPAPAAQEQASGGKSTPAMATSSGVKVSTVDYPASVNVSSAHMVRSLTTTIRRVKVGRRKFINQKVVRADGPPYLIATGIDRNSGLLYLGAFKPYQGEWIATNEPFSQIPQHFLENLSGQANFSGNDLVLAVSSQSGNSNLPKPKSATYQIVLHLVGGHYQVAGSPSKDMPTSIISYFLQSFKLNRLDLAKAWLADPGLISIPKYAGIAKMNEGNWKLVAMSQPANGGYRFRLVTNNSHDLIFDLGAAKHQLMIKGIFIAPPDPLAKALSGTAVNLQASPPGTASQAPVTVSGSSSGSARTDSEARPPAGNSH